MPEIQNEELLRYQFRLYQGTELKKIDLFLRNWNESVEELYGQVIFNQAEDADQKKLEEVVRNRSQKIDDHKTQFNLHKELLTSLYNQEKLVKQSKHDLLTAITNYDKAKGIRLGSRWRDDEMAFGLLGALVFMGITLIVVSFAAGAPLAVFLIGLGLLLTGGAGFFAATRSDSHQDSEDAKGLEPYEQDVDEKRTIVAKNEKELVSTATALNKSLIQKPTHHQVLFKNAVGSPTLGLSEIESNSNNPKT